MMYFSYSQIYQANWCEKLYFSCPMTRFPWIDEVMIYSSIQLKWLLLCASTFQEMNNATNVYVCMTHCYRLIHFNSIVYIINFCTILSLINCSLIFWTLGIFENIIMKAEYFKSHIRLSRDILQPSSIEDGFTLPTESTYLDKQQYISTHQSIPLSSTEITTGKISQCQPSSAWIPFVFHLNINIFLLIWSFIGVIPSVRYSMLAHFCFLYIINNLDCQPWVCLQTLICN